MNDAESGVTATRSKKRVFSTLYFHFVTRLKKCFVMHHSLSLAVNQKVVRSLEVRHHVNIT